MKSFLDFTSCALVAKGNRHSLVQEGKLTKSRGESGIIELELRENLLVRLEEHGGAALRFRDLSEGLQLRIGGATAEIHIVLLAVALYPNLENFGQSIYHRNPNAVQPARHLVATLVELAAGVQNRHRQLDSRNLFGGMNVDRYAAPVVDNGYRVIGVNRRSNAVGITSQRLVDRVVDDFINEMMQPARRR